jgi:uncharacterized membrane protein
MRLQISHLALTTIFPHYQLLGPNQGNKGSARRTFIDYHTTMSLDSLPGSPSDIAAAIFFLVGWSLFAYGAEGYFSTRPTLTSAMNRQREAWMRTMAQRDLRMVDTGIMSGLQQGTAFFASSCIFAIGGCFALLGSADAVMEVLGDLPATSVAARPVFEAKVLGLVAILSYAFFKFGWAYRLFNYCSILIGAVPIPRLDREVDAESDIAVGPRVTDEHPSRQAFRIGPARDLFRHRLSRMVHRPLGIHGHHRLRAGRAHSPPVLLGRTQGGDGAGPVAGSQSRAGKMLSMRPVVR